MPLVVGVSLLGIVEHHLQQRKQRPGASSQMRCPFLRICYSSRVVFSLCRP